MWGLSQAAKTLDFHSRSRGSIPLAPTTKHGKDRSRSKTQPHTLSAQTLHGLLHQLGYPGHDIKPSTLIAAQPNRLRHRPLKPTFSGSSPDTATTLRQEIQVGHVPDVTKNHPYIVAHRLKARQSILTRLGHEGLHLIFGVQFIVRQPSYVTGRSIQCHPSFLKASKPFKLTYCAHSRQQSLYKADT